MITTKPRIQPSILAADFARIQEEVQRIDSADGVHVDVMDNHFVPNLTFGPQMVQAIQRISPIPLDVHLMITDVDQYAPEYAELGVFSVTFHAEATQNPVTLARRIRQIGSRASLALKPATEIRHYLEILSEFDQVLVMTVEPGFGGQKFMPEMMPKLRALRSAADRAGIDLWLQVDGGITQETIGIAAEAGADTFVAGSSVYGAADVVAAITKLRASASGARRAH